MCIYKRFSFQDEYRQFLLSYGVEYDEAYVLIKAFALTGRGDSTMWKTQGVASLALGYVLHWAFSPSLLNPKPQGVASLVLGYVYHWAFIDILGWGSAIQASLIAFALHDVSARPC